MPHLAVTTNIEETPWEDLIPKRGTDQLIEAMGDTGALRIGGLPRGMVSGRTSVVIALDLLDGRTVITETSLALFLSAARILAAKYHQG